MKTLISAALLGAIAISAPAHAVVVVSGNGFLDTSDPTQTNRVFRDAVASTWAAQKAFPGTIGGTFRYDLVNGTFAANATQAIYYEITYSSVNAVVSQPFAVAYNGPFNPANIATNYIGDSGSSADVNGSDRVFQVVVAAGGSLDVNFSEVIVGRLPSDYKYSISAYSDAFRNENFGAVPEPATWAMMIFGFGLVGGALRSAKRKQKLAVSFA